jgi:hypothetical protein
LRCSLRTLWLFPILHGSGETLYTFSDDEVQSLYGISASEYYGRISLAWTEGMAALDRAIVSGRLPLRGLHIFCDGLPTGQGEPNDTLTQRRKAGSRDALLMDTLARRGAHIHGTEDDVLLIEHALLYERWGKHRRFPCSLDRAIRRLRDDHIARRIALLVPDDGHALLLMGSGHAVHRQLRARTPDFRIRTVSTHARQLWRLLQNKRHANLRVLRHQLRQLKR